MHFILSTLLAFAGLAAAVMVFGLNLFLLLRRRQGWSPVFYLLISAAYGFLTVRTLVRQSGGIACAMAPQRTLFIYGGLLALHLLFLTDSLRQLKANGKGADA